MVIWTGKGKKTAVPQMVIHMHEPSFTPKLYHIHLIYNDPNKPQGAKEFNTCNALW